MIDSLRSWQAPGGRASRRTTPPKPESELLGLALVRLRVLDDRMQAIQKALSREHTALISENARLLDQTKRQDALIRQGNEHAWRLKSRIIVLKARNYDLRRQLEEANAFLTQSEP